MRFCGRAARGEVAYQGGLADGVQVHELHEFGSARGYTPSSRFSLNISAHWTYLNQ
jgi:hypothetical protein